MIKQPTFSPTTPLLHIWLNVSLNMLRYDFGVIITKNPIASGGLHPRLPASEIHLCIQTPFQKIPCIYEISVSLKTSSA